MGATQVFADFTETFCSRPESGDDREIFKIKSGIDWRKIRWPILFCNMDAQCMIFVKNVK